METSDQWEERGYGGQGNVGLFGVHFRKAFNEICDEVLGVDEFYDDVVGVLTEKMHPNALLMMECIDDDFECTDLLRGSSKTESDTESDTNTESDESLSSLPESD